MSRHPGWPARLHEGRVGLRPPRLRDATTWSSLRLRNEAWLYSQKAGRYAKAGEAPWGGLPAPRLLCARLTCDCIHRVFSLWAEAFGAELFEIDHPGASDLPVRIYASSSGKPRSPSR